MGLNFHIYQLNSSIFVQRSFVAQIVGRSHQQYLYLRMLEKGLQLKTTAGLIFFLYILVFEKLVNKRLVDHLEECSFFSDFQYGFRSTADLLTVVSDRILGLSTVLGQLEL